MKPACQPAVSESPPVKARPLALAALFTAALSTSTIASAAAPDTPDAPTGTVSGNRILLDWPDATDDEAVTGYNIYRDGAYVTTVPNSQGNISFGSGDVASIAVVAFDSPTDGSARGYSPLSEATAFSRSAESAPTVDPIDPVAAPPESAPAANANPTAPTDLVATRTSDTTVNLTWEASIDSDGVAGYNVYRDNQYVTSVVNTRVRDIELEAGVDYDYYVIAYDTPRNFSARSATATALAAGNDTGGGEADPETPSEGGGAIAVDAIAPSAPDNVTVSVAPLANVVRWDESTDNVGVVGYNVYRNGDYHVTTSGPLFADTGRATDSDSYYIVAFDEARNFSPRSAEITASSEPAPVGPIEEPVEEEAVEEEVEEPAEEEPAEEEPAEEETVEEEAVEEEAVEEEAAEEAPAEEEEEEVPAEEAPEEEGNNDDEPLGNPPTLDEPFADAIPATSLEDPFGFELETDPEAPTPGGPPTQPKNLRLDIVGNDWAEFSWAPSNDDGEVVAYEVTRSDGMTYLLTPALPEGLSLDPGTYDEYAKYWTTTSFMDCNNTRFAFAPGSEKDDDAPWNCVTTGPRPGDDFTYTVAAIDDEDQRSPESEPLEIAFAEELNSPVPFYDDIYLGQGDRFASVTDLSEVEFFIDDFDLVFEDEFDGNDIDPDLWNTGLVWADTRIINGEQQYFVNTQVNPDFGYDPFNLNGEADDGALDGEGLSIEAVPIPNSLRDELPPVCEEEDPTGLDRCEFLSGALSSHDRFSFIYGYVEGRIRASTTPGSLSSFYLYHRYEGGESDIRLRHGPEIDILEYLGENPFGDPDAFQTYHFVDPNTGIIRSSPTMFEEKNPDDSSDVFGGEYHTFGVLWEPQLVVWYIDGVEIARLRGPQIGRQPMNIVNYLVAGSAWAPTPDASDASIFPLQMDIDYIRVYQREAFEGTANFGY